MKKVTKKEFVEAMWMANLHDDNWKFNYDFLIQNVNNTMTILANSYPAEAMDLIAQLNKMIPKIQASIKDLEKKKIQYLLNAGVEGSELKGNH